MEKTKSEAQTLVNAAVTLAQSNYDALSKEKNGVEKIGIPLVIINGMEITILKFI